MSKKNKILLFFLLVLLLFSISYSFTFAVIGDRTGRPMRGVFEKNLSEILKTDAKFIIQLGDILENSSVEQYEFIKNLINNIKIPIYFVPGNHDLLGDPEGKKFQEFTRKPLYYYFDYENARFIILNNSSGKIGKEQMGWLIDVLENTKTKYKFVFMHQPVIAPSFFFLFHKADPIESIKLMEIFEKYQVNYVFSGHIHMYYRKEINGVIYIISGIGGATPYVSPEVDAGKPHFILINISEKGIVDNRIIIEK
ncbi:MAG: metallophosphoesterase [Dictyoglomaceae bacterium]